MTGIMSKYRNHLPQMDGGLFLTDGGLETTLVYHDGRDLPEFAAFDLMRTKSGAERLRAYFTRYAEIARGDGTGFILESPTWRASADWGEKLGYSRDALRAVNAESLELMVDLRDALETDTSPMVISGCIGPRGDGYIAGRIMTAEAAAAYHGEQIGVFAASEADMVAALTMTNTPEAIGITRAARATGLPAAIAFTVETDGRLPTGDSLKTAIETVDAATDKGPAYYMINCAHPTHFADRLKCGEDWTTRIQGIHANASSCSHAELDASTELDDGNPVEFGAQYADLRRHFPWINVLGGCCGTDHRHIERISAACRDETQAAA